MEKQHCEIEITAVRTADLAVNPRNARKHTQKQVAQIAASIQEFGFTNPVLVNEKGRIIAGHGRLLAAKLLGREFIPAIRLTHLTAAQERALAIADNKIPLNASWDLEILSEELEIMSAPDFEIDVGVLGFDTPEIDLIIGEPAGSLTTDTADEPVGIDRTKPAVTQLGDLWICGKHRLYCGSALESAAYNLLMDGEPAQMIITDPPYNVKIDGHVSGLGKPRHQEFAMASGEMTEGEFKSFLHSALGCMAANSIDGALVFVFMDWRHMPEILAAGVTTFSELKNLCVWNKTNGGMGSLYRSKHELVFVFKNGTAPHINNVELGRHGRYRANVWDYAGANSFGRNRKSDLETHPDHLVVSLRVTEVAPSETDQSESRSRTDFLTIVWTKPSAIRKREILGNDKPVTSARPIRSEARTRLLKAVAQGRYWMDQLISGDAEDIAALSAKHQISEKTVRSTLSLAFLAPDIVQAAIDGRLPRGLGVSQMTDLPADWDFQRQQFGLG